MECGTALVSLTSSMAGGDVQFSRWTRRLTRSRRSRREFAGSPRFIHSRSYWSSVMSLHMLWSRPRYFYASRNCVEWAPTHNGLRALELLPGPRYLLQRFDLDVCQLIIQSRIGGSEKLFKNGWPSQPALKAAAERTRVAPPYSRPLQREHIAPMRSILLGAYGPRTHGTYNSPLRLQVVLRPTQSSAIAMQFTKLFFSLALAAVAVTATTIPIHGLRELEARCICIPQPDGSVVCAGLGCPNPNEYWVS
ncbi:hypothetical protein B0H19DRAFT_1182343 [Mycena capillaripes]|nr:hypothetical protein B0H19DRAFT_1182343 [Mycena capillaripes]